MRIIAGSGLALVLDILLWLVVALLAYCFWMLSLPARLMLRELYSAMTSISYCSLSTSVNRLDTFISFSSCSMKSAV